MADPPRARESALQRLEALRAPVEMTRIEAILGRPDGDIGSGIHMFVYALDGGGRIRVGTPDARRVMYIELDDGSAGRLIYRAP